MGRAAKGVAGLLLGAAAMFGQNAPESYLEFGTVVSIGRSTVEVQVSDPRLGRVVQRSFLLSRETQADLVHVGENVEVIYRTGPGGESVLNRLIALHGAIPTVGPAPTGPAHGTMTRAASAAAAPVTTPAAVSQEAPAQARPTTQTAAAPRRSRNPPGRGAVNRANPARAAASPPAAETVPPARVPANRTVALGSSATAQVPALVRVPLGGAPAVVNPAAPRVTEVAQQRPGELCNRTANWSAEPITLAVLDFRYPTEQEEARDLARVGGGSGTALADQIYNSLASDPQLALSRGDREKLFRMDFAGAARLGRQLGVDTVLLGTFVPVEQPVTDPEFPPPTQAYTLRAGVVETCTGELLYKLTSSTCGESAAATCTGAQVTARQAADPGANSAAFALPIANLLQPVLAAGTPAGEKGNAGEVTEVRGAQVTLRLAPGASLRAGDQLGVHASRLAKIPSTNTLHVFRNELIGRMTLTRVSGGFGYGSFAGEPAPEPGDLLELIPE